MSSSPSSLDPVVIPLLRGGSVLDVGCGYGRWANLISRNRESPYLDDDFYVDGLDAFKPNVDYCASLPVYRNVMHLELPQALDQQWDTVLACECIEHIAQEAAEKTVAMSLAAARKRIIFSTPNFPAYRAGRDSHFGFNDYEAHLSYLPRSYFKDRGYNLIGAGWGNHTSLVVRGIKKWKFSWETMIESIPLDDLRLGQQLVAYKDLDQPTTWAPTA